MPRPVFSRGEPVGRSVDWMKWETLWFRDGNNIIIIILFRGQEERFLLLVFVVEKFPKQPQPHTNRPTNPTSPIVITVISIIIVPARLLLYTPTTIPLKHTAPCAHEFRVLVCVCVPVSVDDFPFSFHENGRIFPNSAAAAVGDVVVLVRTH